MPPDSKIPGVLLLMGVVPPGLKNPGGQNYIFLGEQIYTDRNIIFFLFIFLWRWWGGGGFIINIFIFFLWRCVTHHWGRVWGVNLFQTKWFIFYFLFFLWRWWGGGGYMYFFYFFLFWRWSPLTGGVAAWVKLNAPEGGLFFFASFFLLAAAGWWRKKFGGEWRESEREKEAAQADNL